VLERVKSWWGRPWGRRLAICAIFVAAVLGQFRLGHQPTPIDVSTAPPPLAKWGQSALCIREPVPPGKGSFLLARSGSAADVADVFTDLYFENARLDGATSDLFRVIGVTAAPTGSFHYFTDDDDTAPRSKARACRTEIEIWVDPVSAPVELNLFPAGDLGPDPRYQTLGIRPTRARLLVKTLITGSGHGPEGIGCHKTLAAQGWRQEIPENFPVAFLVEPQGTVKFRFQTPAVSAPAWRDQATLVLEPLAAREVEVTSLLAKLPSPLRARSRTGSPPLLIDGLTLQNDQLKCRIAGKGLVDINGKAQTTNLVDWAKDEPLIAGLYAAINAALIGWLLAAFRGRPKVRSAASGKSACL
jgi:hypothetical protein